VKEKNSKGRIYASRDNEPSLEKDKPRFLDVLDLSSIFKNLF
jgi:hypothetical protein